MSSCPYHHCGITSSGNVTREGHCWCEECHAGPEDGFPENRMLSGNRPDIPAGLLPRATMCDLWYAGIGDYRPWLPPHAVRENTATAPGLYQFANAGPLSYPAETGPAPA